MQLALRTKDATTCGTFLLNVHWFCVLLQDGKTALMFASEKGHASVVEMLLDTDADIDASEEVCSC